MTVTLLCTDPETSLNFSALVVTSMSPHPEKPWHMQPLTRRPLLLLLVSLHSSPVSSVETES